MTFEEIYQGKASDVTKMEIRHGGGKLQTITSPTVIEGWLQEIKDTKLIPSKNQEGVTGYLYFVKMFEGKKMVFSFTTSNLNDYYIENNEKFNESLDRLFNTNSETDEKQTGVLLRTDGKWVQLGHRLFYLEGIVKTIEKNPDGKTVLQLTVGKTYQSETDGVESPYKKGTVNSFFLKETPKKDLNNKRVIIYCGQVSSNDQDDFQGAKIIFVEIANKFVDLNGKEGVLPPEEYPFQF